MQLWKMLIVAALVFPSLGNAVTNVVQALEKPAANSITIDGKTYLEATVRTNGNQIVISHRLGVTSIPLPGERQATAPRAVKVVASQPTVVATDSVEQAYRGFKRILFDDLKLDFLFSSSTRRGNEVYLWATDEWFAQPKHKRRELLQAAYNILAKEGRTNDVKNEFHLNIVDRAEHLVGASRHGLFEEFWIEE